MSWNHAKIAVMAPFAVLSMQAALQKSRGNFTGLILPWPALVGQNAQSGLLICRAFMQGQ